MDKHDSTISSMETIIIVLIIGFGFELILLTLIGLNWITSMKKNLADQTFDPRHSMTPPSSTVQKGEEVDLFYQTSPVSSEDAIQSPCLSPQPTTVMQKKNIRKRSNRHVLHRKSLETIFNHKNAFSPLKSFSLEHDE